MSKLDLVAHAVQGRPAAAALADDAAAVVRNLGDDATEVLGVRVAWPRAVPRYDSMVGSNAHDLSVGLDEAVAYLHKDLGRDIWPVRLLLSGLTIPAAIATMGGMPGRLGKAIMTLDGKLAGTDIFRGVPNSPAERAITRNLLDTVRGSGLLAKSPQVVDDFLPRWVSTPAIQVHVRPPGASPTDPARWVSYTFDSVDAAPAGARKVFEAAAEAERKLFALIPDQ